MAWATLLETKSSRPKAIDVANHAWIQRYMNNIKKNRRSPKLALSLATLGFLVSACAPPASVVQLRDNHPADPNAFEAVFEVPESPFASTSTSDRQQAIADGASGNDHGSMGMRIISITTARGRLSDAICPQENTPCCFAGPGAHFLCGVLV